MFGYFKYRLLIWLLGDICLKSGTFVNDCKDCEMYLDNRDKHNRFCSRCGVVDQALKVWKPKEE